jgi:heme/copper-type cytochrome/quinol oxidase subunit 4
VPRQYLVSFYLAIIIFIVSFIEVHKHFWSLESINYLEAYIKCWLEAVFSVRGQL